MKLRYQILISFIIIAALILPLSLFADVCRVQRVVQPVYSYGYHHGYAQQVLLRQVYPPYYYAVGSELQLDAIAEKLSQRIEQKLIEKQKAMQPQPAAKLVSASCVTCHSPGTKAVKESEAPIYFDATGKLTATAEQKASMLTAVRLGVMPPAKELSDDEYLQLKKELIGQ